MSQPQGKGSSLRKQPGAVLTSAQERVLLEALRMHPAPLRNANARVITALGIAGLLQPTRAEAQPAFALTPAGLDAGARLSAQAVIDAVNQRRSQTLQPPATLQTDRKDPARGKPANWPFPDSAHDW